MAVYDLKDSVGTCRHWKASVGTCVQEKSKCVHPKMGVLCALFLVGKLSRLVQIQNIMMVCEWQIETVDDPFRINQG